MAITKEERVRAVQEDQTTLRKAVEILKFHNVDESVIAVLKDLESELEHCRIELTRWDYLNH